MIDLESALSDLAEHLDHPAGDELADRVRRRLVAPIPLRDRRPDRSRSLVAAAAVLIVVVAATLAIPSSRHAIADWLGIGAIEVRRTDTTTATTGAPARPVPGAPGTASPDVLMLRSLAEASALVDFPISIPRDSSIGPPARIEVDPRPQGGLIVLDYGRFTLVEVAADYGMIAKLVDSTVKVERVTAQGTGAIWISGAHEIAYQTASRALVTDTIRRSGPVLIWPRGDVTLRLEGFATLAEAQKVAASVG